MNRRTQRAQRGEGGEFEQKETKEAKGGGRKFGMGGAGSACARGWEQLQRRE